MKAQGKKGGIALLFLEPRRWMEWVTIIVITEQSSTSLFRFQVCQSSETGRQKTMCGANGDAVGDRLPHSTVRSDRKGRVHSTKYGHKSHSFENGPKSDGSH
jgi:hypothetical protein